MTTTENEVQVYKEILNQLGGNRFLAMTGSKNLLYSSENPNWLSMRWLTALVDAPPSRSSTDSIKGQPVRAGP